MLVIAGNLRLGAQATRRAYLGTVRVFAAEETQWSTDFGGYTLNEAPNDWSVVYPSSFVRIDGWEVVSGGMVSEKKLRIQLHRFQSTNYFGFFLWDIIPESADAEVLMLVERGPDSNSGDFPGAFVQGNIVSGTNNDGVLLAFRNNQSDVTRRTFENGVIGSGDPAGHGGTFNPANPHWLRVRCDGDRYRIRAWPVDDQVADFGLSEEPSAWQFDQTHSAREKIGSLGIAQRTSAFSSTSNEVFYHWFSVGIDGDSAPAPGVARVPVPAPEPAPDPDTFNTFDSTTASFDSIAHTFDEVA